MWVTYLIAMLVILGLLAAWIGIQHLSRSYAEKHPEFGPVPEDGGGCGMFCFCKNRLTCPKQKSKSLRKDKAEEIKPFNQ